MDSLPLQLAIAGLALLVLGTLVARLLPEVFTRRCAAALRRAENHPNAPGSSREECRHAVRQSVRAFRLGQSLVLLGLLSLVAAVVGIVAGWSN